MGFQNSDPAPLAEAIEALLAAATDPRRSQINSQVWAKATSSAQLRSLIAERHIRVCRWPARSIDRTAGGPIRDARRITPPRPPPSMAEPDRGCPLRSSALQDFTLTRSSNAVDLLNSARQLYRVEVAPAGPLTGHRHEVRAITESDFTLGYIQSATPVRVGSGAYFLNLGVQGEISLAQRGEWAKVTRSSAVICNPGESQELRPGGRGAGHLALRLSPSLVDAELTALLGHAVDAPAVFDFSMDLTRPGGSAVSRLVSDMVDQLDSGDPLFRRAEIQRSQVRSLVTALLLAQRNTFSEELLHERSPARPRTLRAALAHVEAHLTEPVTLGDLATAAGCSARTISGAFREHLGMSPMVYVLGLRLDRVREELLTTDDPVGVVAYRWGLTHLGRFARQYRQRFGELPSVTAGRHR
ncbi:AraC family transcriptional regulator [Streptomyces sp. NPDC059474]|uniref:AraC family transcriptional regulator n=1 Tax=unclassified Streptomyces TaxID=2593676 RepID=UPI003401C298